MLAHQYHEPCVYHKYGVFSRGAVDAVVRSKEALTLNRIVIAGECPEYGGRRRREHLPWRRCQTSRHIKQCVLRREHSSGPVIKNSPHVYQTLEEWLVCGSRGASKLHRFREIFKASQTFSFAIDV